jgi:hypothetical protein
MSGLAMGSIADLLAAELSEACAVLRAALGIGTE